MRPIGKSTIKAYAEWISVQFMVNNLLNKEYSYRPMSIEAPRTFVIKLDLNI